MALATRLKLLAWHVLPLLLSGAVIVLALRFANGQLKVWLVAGGALVAALILIQYIIFITHKIDSKIYRVKYGESDGWNYVELPFGAGCMMVFGGVLFPLLALYFILVAIFGVEFDGRSEINFTTLIAFGAFFLFSLLLAVMSVYASYRFLFVKTRYNETHFERWGPLGRPRRLTFQQIRRAGFNSFTSTIWMKPEDGGRIGVWANEFGALGLYIKLHTTLGGRFQGGNAEIDEQLKQGGKA